MSSFRNKSLALYRPTAGSYDAAGIWQPSGVHSSTTIKASVQAPTTRDLLSLPEGRRDVLSYVIFTDTELFPASQQHGTNADVLYYLGEYFEVAKVHRWQNAVIPHYRVVISKVTGPTDIKVGDEQVPPVDPMDPPPIVSGPELDDYEQTWSENTTPALEPGQTVFTLLHTPEALTVLVFVNGQGLSIGSDFSIAGAVITLLPDLGYTLAADDEVQIRYRA